MNSNSQEKNKTIEKCKIVTITARKTLFNKKETESEEKTSSSTKIKPLTIYDILTEDPFFFHKKFYLNIK